MRRSSCCSARVSRRAKAKENEEHVHGDAGPGVGAFRVEHKEWNEQGAANGQEAVVERPRHLGDRRDRQSDARLIGQNFKPR